MYVRGSGGVPTAWPEPAVSPVVPLHEMSEPHGRPDILQNGTPISGNFPSPVTCRVDISSTPIHILLDQREYVTKVW